MKHYKTVLFDLDGTLLDTSKGILGAVKYAQQQMNLPSLPDSRLREFIGPPPVESYKRIFGVCLLYTSYYENVSYRAKIRRHGR